MNSLLDNEDPVIHGMPSDIFQPIIGCGGNADAVVVWIEPTVTDNSGYPILSSNYASGDSMPYGVTTVTYTAADGSGNTVSQSMTATLITLTGMYDICLMHAEVRQMLLVYNHLLTNNSSSFF